MNTETLQGRKRIRAVEPHEGGMEKPGDFCFSENFDYIFVWLPGGRGGPDAIRIQKGPQGGPRVWGWDGNEDLPTLTPSIHAHDQWHGHLVKGVFQSC